MPKQTHTHIWMGNTVSKVLQVVFCLLYVVFNRKFNVLTNKFSLKLMEKLFTCKKYVCVDWMTKNTIRTHCTYNDFKLGNARVEFQIETMLSFSTFFKYETC